MKTLNPEYERLLRDILRKRMVSDALAGEVLSRVKSKTLTKDDEGFLCDMLLKEFTSTGLRGDSEPTSHGQKLEELIDLVRRLRQGD